MEDYKQPALQPAVALYGEYSEQQGAEGICHAAAVGACERSAQWGDDVNWVMAQRTRRQQQQQQQQLLQQQLQQQSGQNNHFVANALSWRVVCGVQCIVPSFNFSDLVLVHAILLRLGKRSRSSFERDTVGFNLAASKCEKQLLWFHAFTCRILTALTLEAFDSGGLQYSRLCRESRRPMDAWIHGIALLSSALDQQVSLNIIAWNAAIRGGSDQGAGGWCRTLFLLRQAATKAPPTPASFGGVLHACRSSGAWHASSWLLEVSGGARMLPSAVSATSALAAFKASASWPRTLALAASLGRGNLEPDTGFHRVCVAATTDWVRCMEALQQVTRGKSEEMLTDLSAAVAKAGCWQQCLSLGSARTPSAVRLNTVLGSLQSVKLWEVAIQLLRNSPCDRIYADTTSFHTAAAATAELWSWTLAMLAAMVHCRLQQNIVSVNTGVAAPNSPGRWHHALSRLGHGTTLGIRTDLVGWSTSIAACSAARHWQTATDMFHALSEHRMTADVLCSNLMLGCYAETGCWQLAVQLLLHEMCDMSVIADEISWISTITSCATTSQWQLALGLLTDMRLSRHLVMFLLVLVLLVAPVLVMIVVVVVVIVAAAATVRNGVVVVWLLMTALDVIVLTGLQTQNEDLPTS
ncbi:Pentatricopeptide repeat-containing protein, chloroplastic [Symbiodinium microadriaticum]|uniref:Pentatricopeptide repeat-containing protein, chloroplastic n=1 Tax=Symbiodinium microadriaticum TaxID=2951 RepID=A0A1Q9EFZ3_SYMMI|nr:Pentatricopeptide repeat-containing protein, chloroplastic [Symbiodinium microadriaticum]